jgi:HME family heavy-metal exporter
MGLSAVFVEFDWNANVYLARQTVQERLSSVASALPETVKPQMGPIGSIMGQVMQFGLHRRPGPHGGILAPVGNSGLLAELLHNPREGRFSLAFWKPTDRQHPENWEPVTLPGDTVELNWAPGPQSSVLSPELPALTLRANEGSFAVTDPRLAGTDVTAAIDAAECHTTVSVKGKPERLVFPTAVQRNMAVRTLADWVIRPRLLKLGGIAQVVVAGGGRKQYQVLVDPMALLDYDVTLEQVADAVKRNNVSSSGGFALRGEDAYPIRIQGRLGPDAVQVVEDLRQVPVKPTPQRTVLMQQVARIVEGPQIKQGETSINGFPGVVLTVNKQPHTDTRALTDEIKKALHEVEPSLPPEIVVNTELFQMKRFIDKGVYNVGEALVIGAVLVLIILFLFLLNVRTTFISLTAIPLSLVITALVFRLTGWLTGTQLSINIMTLGGIAIAMGELVDDAIVDVENIYRRLRENSGSAHPKPVLQVIYEASIEVRSAIVFGTAMVILVFLPLFALSGIEGRLFTPLGIAYITSILASLLVSLTVTPVLSFYLLKGSALAPRVRKADALAERVRYTDSPLLRWLKWLATPLVRFSMAHPVLILLATWLSVAGCVVVLVFLGKAFLPDFDEGSIQVGVNLPAGSSLEASNNVCRMVDGKFRELQVSPDNPHALILQFFRRSGRAELDEHADPVNQTDYILGMNPDSGRSREEAITEILKELREAVPGVDLEVEQPLAHLLSHMLSGVSAQIAIKIYGDDLDQLRRTAEKVKTSITGVEGLAPPVIETQDMTQELHIRMRPEQLAHYGVDRARVAEFVHTALRGEELTEVLEGQRRFGVAVLLDGAYRDDYFNLGRLQMDLPANRGRVPLKELCDVGIGLGANQVGRENARRLIVIRCNTLGRDLSSVVGDIRDRVEQNVKMPEGYFVEYGGQFESQQRATTLITILALVSVVGMFVVLFMLYPSVRIVLQILNALPAAFVGGVLALVLTRQTLTVASMVGFISLGGIAARNGILLVSHYFHLMKHEGEGFTPHMIVRGSLERLAPVLMTALTAGIALAPLVWAGHEPGREILYPVATVILGGLITSTLCEFLIHPGLFWRFSGKDALRLAKVAAAEQQLLAEPKEAGNEE